jgi:predicted DNA-binding protein (UPF0251 family)
MHIFAIHANEHMPRLKCKRNVCFEPGTVYFKPAGIPVRELEEVVIYHDELESIRLCDLEGLYHEQAAEQMHVSRQTIGRMLESARKKIADAMIHGKAIRFEKENSVKNLNQ